MSKGIYKRIHPAWNKEQKLSEGHKRKISLSLKGKLIGENASHWKGDDIGYRALHKWIEGVLGKPRCCEDCGIKTLNHRQYHWANLSGYYKRVISDWRRLCVKCHSVYDRQQKLLRPEVAERKGRKILSFKFKN